MGLGGLWGQVAATEASLKLLTGCLLPRGYTPDTLGKNQSEGDPAHVPINARTIGTLPIHTRNTKPVNRAEWDDNKRTPQALTVHTYGTKLGPSSWVKSWVKITVCNS